MKPASLYQRTAKGAAELARRSHAIPARARSLLLLVDGKSTGAQLLERLAALPNCAELLQLLEDGGYIEGLDTAAELVREEGVPVRAEIPEPGLDPAKQFFVDSLEKVLGPDAGLLTGKVKEARSAGELRQLAEKYREILIEVGKRRRGEAFWQQFEELLPRPDGTPQ